MSLPISPTGRLPCTPYPRPPRLPKLLSKLKPGKQFASADVEVCAKEQIRENIFDFELGTSDNVRLSGSTRGTQPPFGATDIAPGDCVRGYITYEIPQEAAPTYVHYDGPQDEMLRWEV